MRLLVKTPFSYFIYAACICIPVFLSAQDQQMPQKDISITTTPVGADRVFSEGIIVDLKNPEFSQGVLSTTQGGVVTNDYMRIQAKNIRYTRQQDSNPPVFTLEAEGDLCLDYQGRLFVGEKLHYDFLKKEGTLEQAKTDIDDWYIGGTSIHLFPDGSFEIDEAFVTTCGNDSKDWQIKASKVFINAQKRLLAKQLQVRFLGMPFLWLPTYESDLAHAFDAPVRLKFHWGGGQGPRVGMRNRLFINDFWKTFYRVDYRANRGISTGIEGTYEDPMAKRSFQMKNTLAYDTSLLDEEKRTRYELFGLYKESFDQEKYDLKVQYDKLSDSEVVTDYYDKSFNLLSTKNTEASFSRNEDNWKASVYSRVRVNPFETTLEHLPSLYWHQRPFYLGDSGLLFSQDFNVGYLDYKFADDSLVGYRATRLKTNQEISYPFQVQHYSLTPYAGVEGYFYDQGPQTYAIFQPVGILGLKGNTQFIGQMGDWRHRVTPYFHYKSYFTSNDRFADHYIFNSDDARVRLNQMRIGVSQGWSERKDDVLRQKFRTDLYTYGFFAQTTGFDQVFPKTYCDCTYYPTDSLSLSTGTSWNHDYHVLDSFNTLVGYTFNEDVATNVEYRHRSRYDWKKSQKENFMVEAYDSVDDLLNSNQSDQRDTYLARLFFRVYPGLGTNLQARYGTRPNEPDFFEWRAELSTILRCTWLMNFGYVQSEAEQRWTISFELVDRKPKRRYEPDVSHYRGY